MSSTSFSVSPLPTYVLPPGQAQQQQAISAAALGTRPADANARLEWSQQLSEVAQLCDVLTAQLDGVVRGAVQAFDSPPDAPEQMIAFLNNFESLRQRLAASGIGALSATEMDINALIERRAKETQANFTKGQKLVAGAAVVRDVLGTQGN